MRAARRTSGEVRSGATNDSGVMRRSAAAYWRCSAAWLRAEAAAAARTLAVTAKAPPTVELTTGDVHELPTVDGVIDPRVDPTGRRVAYAADGALRVVDLPGGSDGDRAVATPQSPTEVWGQAEFIAAEEMGRFRGFWWAPDGESLLVERYDDAAVTTWHVADPEHHCRDLLRGGLDQSVAPKVQQRPDGDHDAIVVAGVGDATADGQAVVGAALRCLDGEFRRPKLDHKRPPR